ncbi:PKD domain-containing protein [Chloroflexota bacterium]
MESSLHTVIWRITLALMALCLILLIGCTPPNNDPVITSLDVEQDWTLTSGKIDLEAIATDADGDSLNYDWSASEGKLSSTGSVATWTAPDAPGTYTITVEVTDGKDGKAAIEQTIIKVRENHPPVIESVTADPEVVLRNETTVFTCVASDPDGDELSYDWIAPIGSFSGEGSIVTWTAPTACTTYTVTVNVADDYGGEANKNFEIRVKKPG